MRQKTRFNSYEIFNDWTRKSDPLNTGDLMGMFDLIEVTSWAGLTVHYN